MEGIVKSGNCLTIGKSLFRMEKNQLVGKITVTARYLPNNEIVSTTVIFEDREDSVYYCWRFTDSFDKPIAGKCLPISKRIIDIDKFDFSINHLKFSIDNCRVDRRKIFEIIEISKH